MNTRRDAMRIIGAAWAALPAEAQEPLVHPHTHSDTAPAVEVAGAAAAYKPFLQPDEFRVIEEMSERIIPRSDTPGAKDAGVALLIDKAIVAKPGMGETYRAGIADLNEAAHRVFGQDFTALTEAQQVEVLTPLSLDDTNALGKFFALVKNMVIDAYYRTEAGLKTELGWHGNTYLPDFPGCDHPGHHNS